MKQRNYGEKASRDDNKVKENFEKLDFNISFLANNCQTMGKKTNIFSREAALQGVQIE